MYKEKNEKLPINKIEKMNIELEKILNQVGFVSSTEKKRNKKKKSKGKSLSELEINEFDNFFK